MYGRDSCSLVVVLCQWWSCQCVICEHLVSVLTTRPFDQAEGKGIIGTEPDPPQILEEHPKRREYIRMTDDRLQEQTGFFLKDTSGTNSTLWSVVSKAADKTKCNRTKFRINRVPACFAIYDTIWSLHLNS